ncbi:MAG: CvpA family protein, partial [Wenzhouxiangella sp.]
MSTADLVILAICGISMLVSLFRGFVREAFSLVVWFLA